MSDLMSVRYSNTNQLTGVEAAGSIQCPASHPAECYAPGTQVVHASLVQGVIRQHDATLSTVTAERDAAIEKWPADKYDDRQREWLNYYEHETGFEPMMGDYEVGNQTFVEAALVNIDWFESWSSDALSHVSGKTIPGSEFDLDMRSKEATDE